MKVKRLAFGIVCLGLASAAGWYGWQHRDYYTKVRTPDPQSIKAIDLAANGPGEIHAVRISDMELGEPIVIPRRPNEYPDVWFPLYPARKGHPLELPSGTPLVLFHTQQLISSKESAAVFRQRADVSGTVMNGLHGANVAVPPEVMGSYPRIDPGTVWIVRGDRVWQEEVLIWTAPLTAMFGVLGLWFGATGLFGRSTPRHSRDSRRLRGLRRLGPHTSSLASRAYFHAHCGMNTLVSGDDLVVLECPFRSCPSTYCCGCQSFVPLTGLQWEDTGEYLVAYRERIASTVPFWTRIRLHWMGTAYEGAVNLGLDDDGRVIQPLRDPPGGAKPLPSFNSAFKSRY